MRRTQFVFAVLSVVLFAWLFSACGPRQIHTGTTSTTLPGNRDTGKNPTPPPSKLPPTISSFTAEPNPITMGQSTMLSWRTSNVTGVSIDNGIGTVEDSGSRRLSPSRSITYKVTATGAEGRIATAEVRITVDSPPVIIDTTKPDNKTPVVGGGPEDPQPTGDQTLLLDLKDIFFGYNQYDIRDEDRAVLLKNVRLLKDNPKARITIGGYCDERGSEKYNLALGDRRAIAAKDFLTAQGVENERIDTISYGKENPFCEDHNEECWQLNRRASFNIR
jgi:peptidoglycan-associated lipoprotein